MSKRAASRRPAGLRFGVVMPCNLVAGRPGVKVDCGVVELTAEPGVGSRLSCLGGGGCAGRATGGA